MKPWVVMVIRRILLLCIVVWGVVLGATVVIDGHPLLLITVIALTFIALLGVSLAVVER